MWNRKRNITVILLSSALILTIFNSFTIQPAKGGIPNGNPITNVGTSYSFGGNSICFDGAFYYVLYNTETSGTWTFAYAYATNPLGTWTIVPITTGSQQFTYTMTCGLNGALNIISYGLSLCVCSSVTVYITSIRGGVIGNTNTLWSKATAADGYLYSLSMLNNFNTYPAPKNLVWIAINYASSQVGCGLSGLEVVGVYPPNTIQGAEAGTLLDYNSSCNYMGGQIFDNNGLPAILYNCDNFCAYGGHSNINEIQMNKIINQTTYFWTTPVYTSAGFTGGQYYDYQFSTTFYNGNMIALGGCYQSSVPTASCYLNYVLDYWSFNLANQTWTKVSSNIAGSLSAGTVLQLTVDEGTGIVRSYYFSTEYIKYFYPLNETGNTVHIGYDSAGNTIESIYPDSPIQANNYYYVYFVSSTNPALLEWASYTTQPIVSSKTFTQVTYTTVTVTPALSKCTNTNSCTTNQFSQFMVVLLPTLIILALMEYFPYKMGIKDERVYIFIFMLVISAVGFLSSLGGFGQNGIPWYIPIFSDIVGFMLIITKRNGNGGL